MTWEWIVIIFMGILLILAFLTMCFCGNISESIEKNIGALWGTRNILKDIEKEMYESNKDIQDTLKKINKNLEEINKNLQEINKNSSKKKK